MYEKYNLNHEEKIKRKEIYRLNLLLYITRNGEILEPEMVCIIHWSAKNAV